MARYLKAQQRAIDQVCGTTSAGTIRRVPVFLKRSRRPTIQLASEYPTTAPQKPVSRPHHAAGGEA